MRIRVILALAVIALLVYADSIFLGLNPLQSEYSYEWYFASAAIVGTLVAFVAFLITIRRR